MPLSWPDGIILLDQKFLPIYPDETLIRTASGKAQPSLPQDPVWRVRCTFAPSHNDAASTLMDAMYGPAISVVMPVQKRLVPTSGVWEVTGSGFDGDDDEYYIDYTARVNVDAPARGQFVSVGDASEQRDLYRITRRKGSRLFLAPKRETRVVPARMVPGIDILVRKLPGQTSWGARNANWNLGFSVDFEEVL